MFSDIFRSIFGTVNSRIIAREQKLVNVINGLEATYAAMTDSDLTLQTARFKERLAQGAKLDDLLPESFAVVREAAKRVLGMRHFDVQLLGGIVLHRGMIAEMKTGEGKTLVATLPCYLNALTGKGVHVVTVNDYLASLAADWMGQVYRFLGLTVSCITNELDNAQRQAAYQADIVYATNSELGFDYLRDNLRMEAEDKLQRDFNYAIVDEVDSILIDEARTPLIISGPTEDKTELYYVVDRIIPGLVGKILSASEKNISIFDRIEKRKNKDEVDEDELNFDYKVDEKDKNVFLTERGMEKIEHALHSAGVLKEGEQLYDLEHTGLVNHVQQALRAHVIMKNEVDYIVHNGEVLIIDEFTGRIQEGRRFSGGLHQAIEAKEGVQVQNENQTLASITYQNYFRLYPKLAGMTGTAVTEATEFEEIYKLKTVVIPSNLPVIRIDEEDEIYPTAEAKFRAIVRVIQECHAQQQPVLVGTVSVEKSEYLHRLLQQEHIPHNVLNAKYHMQEAEIIAQAGMPGAVTIATNMAGRGTDIMLGGNAEMLIKKLAAQIADPEELEARSQEIKEEVAKNKEIAIAAGGLYVIGSERHESRRIDNQLRGRSGRQGDPGRSRFYLSLEDDLMRIFTSSAVQNYLFKMSFGEDEAIKHRWISKSLEIAQKKVERYHYEIRKNVLKYDDVVNEQRKNIFEQRNDILGAENIVEEIDYLVEETVSFYTQSCLTPANAPEQWNLRSLEAEFTRIFGVDVDLEHFLQEAGRHNYEDVRNFLLDIARSVFQEKTRLYGEELFYRAEKQIMLLNLDRYWKEHLYTLDAIRQGINLRAYSQQDPLVEYKKEAFKCFEGMLAKINEETVRALSHVIINSSEAEAREHLEAQRNLVNALDKVRALQQATANSLPQKSAKVNRNDPCPCGSGKKYKHCCGANS